MPDVNIEGQVIILSSDAYTVCVTDSHADLYTNTEDPQVKNSTSFVVAKDTTYHHIQLDGLIVDSGTGSGGIGDAPSDGNEYLRKNNVWVKRIHPSPTQDAYLYGMVDSLDTFRNVAIGNSPDVDARFVSINDLIDFNLIQRTGGGIDTTGPKHEDTPPAPTQLTASSGVGVVELTWFPPQFMYLNHKHTEIWVNISDDRNTATKVTDLLNLAKYTHTGRLKGTLYYYWIRFVSVQNVTGPFNSVVGTYATSTTVADLLETLSGEIRASELYTDLRTPIELIDAMVYGQDQLVQTVQANAEAAVSLAQANAQALADEVTARAQALSDEVNQRQYAAAIAAQEMLDAVSAEAQARADALLDEGTARVVGLLNEAVARGAAITTVESHIQTVDESLQEHVVTITAALGDNAAAIQTEQTARVTAIEAEALARTTLAARVSTAETAITTEQTVRASQDEAIAGQITTINASLGTNAAAIQTEQQVRASAIEAEALARTTLATRVTTAESAIVIEQGARVTQDLAIANQITTLTTGVNDNATAITNEITNRTTAVSAEATARNALSSKIMGAGNPNNLDEVSSGLLYEAKESITNLEGSLVQQIALLSVGSNNQFDYAKIWYFDSGIESWWANGTPTAVNGWLRPPPVSAPYVGVGLVNHIDGTKYPQVRARIRKVGNPTWYGLFYYLIPSDQTWGTNGKLDTITEPDFDTNNIGNITWNLSGAWSANQITSILYQLSVTADASNYYEVDWIAVGRPSPGASSADLYNEQTARTNADGALSQQITNLSGVVDGKASGSALSALTVRVEDTEDSISATSSDLTLLKSKLAFSENTLDPSVWVVGTQGSQGAWSVNGAANESEIVLAGTGTVPLGPLKAVEKLWQCQELGDNNSSGGYNVVPIAANKIDKSIGTVFSTFVRHNGATSGHIYHGCDRDGGIQNLNGTYDYNPYWIAHPVGFFTPDRWYLLYGVVSPEGTTVSTGLSGIYDCETGIRVADAPDFRCSPVWNGSAQTYRDYWYYSDDTTHKVWFAQPRVVPLNQSLSPWQLMSINPALAGASTALESLDSRVEATEAGLEVESSKVTRLQANQNITSMVRNPFFDWPDGADRPTEWNHWNGGAAKHVDGVRFNLAANQEGGLEYVITQNAKFIDVEITFTLVSGSLNQSGFYANWIGSGGNVVIKYLSDLFTPADIYNKKITANIRLRRPDTFAGAFSALYFYVMGAYGSNATSAKDLIVHAVKVSSANESADAIETLVARTTAINGVNGRTLESIAAKTIALEALVGTAESGAFENLEAKVNDSETGVIASSNKIVQLKNSMPGGGNLIPGDTDFSKDLGGWNLGYNDSNGIPTLLHNTNSHVQPPDAKTLEIHNPSATYGACSAGIVVPVTPGIRYCFSAYLSAYRCYAQLLIQWFNSSGGWFATSSGSSTITNNSANSYLSNYFRDSLFAVAPAGAFSARINVFCSADTSYGTDPYLFFGHPSFNEVTADTTVIPPYTPSSVGWYKNTSDALETLTTSVNSKDSAQSTKYLNLRAQLEVKSLVANPYFLDFTENIPTGWARWYGGGTVTKVASGVQISTGNGQQDGIYYPIPFADYKNIDVELSFTITSGELYGAGVLIEYANAHQTFIKLTDYYSGAYLILNKKVSLTLRLKRPANAPSNSNNPNIFLMAGWATLGALPAKTIIFHSCVVTASDKSAEAIEILDTQVNNTETGLVAQSTKILNLRSQIGGAESETNQQFISRVTQDVNGQVTALSGQITVLSAALDGGIGGNLWQHDSECVSLGVQPNWGFTQVAGNLLVQSLEYNYPSGYKPTACGMLGQYTNAQSGTWAAVFTYTGTTGYGVPVTPGKHYTFRCKWAHAFNIGVSCSLQFRWCDAAGGIISQNSVGGSGGIANPPITDITKWGDLTCVGITAPTNAVYLTVIIGMTATNPGAAWCGFTRFAINVVSSAGAVAPAYQPNQQGTFANIASQLQVQASAISSGATATQQLVSALVDPSNPNGNNFAAVQEKMETLDGVSAQWGVKTQVGDLVGGLGLLNNGTSIDLAITANRLFVMSPSGDGILPFIVQPHPVTGVPTVFINQAAIKELNADLIKVGTLNAGLITQNGMPLSKLDLLSSTAGYTPNITTFQYATFPSWVDGEYTLSGTSGDSTRYYIWDWATTLTRLHQPTILKKSLTSELRLDYTGTFHVQWKPSASVGVRYKIVFNVYTPPFRKTTGPSQDSYFGSGDSPIESWDLVSRNGFRQYSKLSGVDKGLNQYYTSSFVEYNIYEALHDSYSFSGFYTGRAEYQGNCYTQFICNNFSVYNVTNYPPTLATPSDLFEKVWYEVEGQIREVLV